jgi:hypothetical protein
LAAHRREGRLVGIRERLRHFEAAVEAEMIVIAQRDGTVARFPHSPRG